MRKFIGFILLLIILLISCDSPLKQKELKEFSLSSVLSPDHKYQNVYLYQTSQEITEKHQHINFFISDANVFISYNNYTIPLKYYEKNKNMQYNNLYGPAYSDKYNPLKIDKGGKYRIIVKCPDTCLIGSTIIPEKLNIKFPLPVDTISSNNNIRVKLDINNINRRMTIDLYSPRMKGLNPTSLEDTIIIRSHLYQIDTLGISKISIDKEVVNNNNFIANHRLNFKYIENSMYLLKVKLWDKNITEYHFGNDVSSGIKYGGYGYVGSYISDSVKFYIRE